MDKSAKHHIAVANLQDNILGYVYVCVNAVLRVDPSLQSYFNE